MLDTISISLSASFLTISVKNFALSATSPSSKIVQLIYVSIPRLRLLAVSLTSPFLASIRIHSRIGFTALVDTALDTILSPVSSSLFLHLILIISPFSCITIHDYLYRIITRARMYIYLIKFIVIIIVRAVDMLKSLIKR